MRGWLIGALGSCAFMLATGVAAARPAPAPAAVPGVSVESLIPLPRPANAERAFACSKDRVWCISFPVQTDDEQGGSLTILHQSSGGLRTVGSMSLAADGTDEAEGADRFVLSPFMRVVRFTVPGEDERVLIGVRESKAVGYSGGSAEVSTVVLHEVTPGNRAMRPAFTAPLASDIGLRACFSERDARRRRGACLDQYTYRARFTPAGNPPSGAVALTFKSVAATYPGKLSRSVDSTAGPALRRSDLRRAVDTTCSVSRTLTRDPSTGVFAWDSPLPDCTDFLEP